MRERAIPPVRPARDGEAVRLIRDARGRPLLRVPEGAPPDAPALFMRGWRRADGMALRERDGARLLREAAVWAEAFARRLAVPVPALALMGGTRAWGTCSPRGLIRLHEDLSRMPDGAAREAVLHELCHLRVPDHRPAFWALMTETMPDWPEWEGVLRCLARKR